MWLEEGFSGKLAVSMMVFAETSLLIPTGTSDKADKALKPGVKRLGKFLVPHSSLADLFLS